MLNQDELGAKHIRNVNRIEMAALTLIALFTVVPIKFGFNVIEIDADTIVTIYYTASIITFAIFQYIYIRPISSFRILNRKIYVLGNIVFLLAIAFWIRGGLGRILDFSHLDRGAIFSPIAFALSMPLVHAIVHLVGANSSQNMIKNRKTGSIS